MIVQILKILKKKDHQINQLTHQKEELEEMLATYRETIDIAPANLNPSSQSLFDRLHKDNKELKEKVFNLQEEKRKLKDQSDLILDLQSQLQAKEKELQHFKRELNDQSQQMEVVLAELSTSKNELKKYEKNSFQSRSEIEELKKEVYQLSNK